MNGLWFEDAAAGLVQDYVVLVAFQELAFTAPKERKMSKQG